MVRRRTIVDLPGYSMAVFSICTQTLFQINEKFTRHKNRPVTPDSNAGRHFAPGIGGIAVPMKYFNADPQWVRIIGPIHGMLFLLFVFNTLSVGIEKNWKFRNEIWKIIVACFIPFGTFYIDQKIFRKL